MSIRNLSWRSRVLHLFALSGLAVAQPLLGILGSEPGFWIARGSTYLDVAIFLVVVLLGIPGLLLGVELLLSKVHDLAGLVFHVSAVGGFLFLISLNVVDTLGGGEMPGVVVIGAAVVAAGVLSTLYWVMSGLREFVSILAIGPIVFAAVFIVGLPALGGTDASLVDAGVDSTSSVVLVILDEFQLAAILDDDGSIDGIKFPNLKRLSDMSTWYPNATTVHDNSLHAVPAILTGQFPQADLQATAEDHPVSVFTLLGGTHEMRVNENITQVCPVSICEESRPESSTSERLSSLASDSTVAFMHVVVPTRLRYRLPPIGTRWGGFVAEESTDNASDSPDTETPLGPIEGELSDLSGGEDRATEYGAFLDSIDPDLGPTLYYLHADIPHAPWSYLPSGKRYPFSDRIPGYTDQGQWRDDEWYTQQANGRFLMNAGFADQLIGRTLDRLEELSMMDDTLVIFTSDHGENFEVDESRRALTQENFAALAGVPLFVKYPTQSAGSIDLRNAQTIDIVPTIVEALGGFVDGIDGTSLLSAEAPSDKEFFSNAGTEFSMSVDEYSEIASEFYEQQRVLWPGGVTIEAAVAGMGPRSDLNGAAITDLEILDVPGEVDNETAEFTRNFDPDGFYDPIAVVADITVSSGQLPEFFAIVVNGTVLSTISAYESNAGTARIYGIVPPGSFRSGENVVEIFGIAGGPGATQLIRYS